MSAPPEPTIGELLEATRAALLQLVRREAGGILRFESEDDLVQGIHARVLEDRHGFEYRGSREFQAWLSTVARSFMQDRRSYWMALKRGAGKVLRLTFGGSDAGSRAGLAPPGSTPGPSTFAIRRETVVLASRAIQALPPRDRQLLAWMSEGLPLSAQAARLRITYDAVQRAAHRALDRFRKTFQLLSGASERR